MGKYIGEISQYGSFEKQKITVISGVDTYTLNHRVVNESSILVVCDRIVLQPVIDYVIIKPSDEFIQKIKFNIDLDALEEADDIIGNIELNIIYLGKELLNSSVASIDNIQDVTINNLLPGQVLQYNGTQWVNADVGTTSGIPAINQRIDVIEAAAATRTYVNNKISELISNSPAALDTLNELAAALGDDPNFATTISGQIGVLDSRLNSLEARVDVSTLDSLIDVSVSSPQKGQFIVHNGTEFVNSNTIQASSSSSKPLVIKGAVSQTANLIELQDSSSAQVFSVDSTGTLSAGIVPVDRIVGLSDVAAGGSYNDLSDTPALSVVGLTGSYNDLLDKPTLSAVSATGSYNDLTNKPALSAVATSGSYNDLNDTPILSSVATSGSYSDLLNTPAPFSGSYNDLTDKPALSAVATSGSYNDLADKPAGFAPTGLLAPFAGSSAPIGWLLCDGSAISRTTYSSLFAVVGTTYGSGDGTTTFNIPDLRSRVPIGLGSTINNTLGSTDGVAENSRSLQHNHTVTVSGHYHSTSGAGSTLSTNIGHTHTASALTINADGGHTHSFSLSTDAQGSHGHTFSLTAASAGGHTHTFTLNADSGGSHSHSITDNGHKHIIDGHGTTTAGDGKNTGNSGTKFAKARNTAVSGTGDTNGETSTEYTGISINSSGSSHGHTVSGSIPASGTEGAHTHTVSGWVGTGTEGSHSHSVLGSITGGSHTHTGTAAGQTLATTNVAASGSIGKVTDGADGNIDNTYTSSNKNNVNYIILNYIIKA